MSILPRTQENAISPRRSVARRTWVGIAALLIAGACQGSGSRGNAELDRAEEDADGTSEGELKVVKVQGDSPCPANHSLATFDEAQQNQDELCDMIDAWGIARLEGGGSMDGSGYGCGIRAEDDRSLGSTMCQDQGAFAVGQGDTPCPLGYRYLTADEARDHSESLCSALEEGEIARLAGGGSLDSKDCKVLDSDDRDLDYSLCTSGSLSEKPPEEPPASVEPNLNVAYVEANSNDIANVGCFSRSDGTPLFDVGVIFAANINYDGSAATVHLNPQVSDLLDNNLDKVRGLQDRGIKVVLSVLNNWQNAGWSCFADEASATAFAEELAGVVEHYGLDGVDIDDEYDSCTNKYDDSLVKVTYALREQMPDKIISKALFADSRHFQARWQGITLADQLDYGWEMSYFSGGTCLSRTQFYLDNGGMERAQVGVGASTSQTSAATARQLAECVVDNDHGGGMMVFNLQASSADYLKAIWGDVVTTPDCLQ